MCSPRCIIHIFRAQTCSPWGNRSDGTCICLFLTVLFTQLESLIYLSTLYQSLKKHLPVHRMRTRVEIKTLSIQCVAPCDIHLPGLIFWLQELRISEVFDLAVKSTAQNFCCGRDIVKHHITAFNRLVSVVGTPLLRPWFWAPDHGRGDPGFGTNLAKLRRVVVVACLVRILRGIGKSSNPGH
ncbi:hypothetical protein EV421DRAFT_1296086 [Armillaria borealis]|uniref:Uncharacterized protein n=1 Tax=Armillaria borealis TaxID=47425 RepID=A0AA39MY00_9AGAR|nr:hypothetical protein EV421DRAFT_1296086 [Armillaria borealis]